MFENIKDFFFLLYYQLNKKEESDLICFVELCGREGLNFFHSWESLLPFWLAKKSFISKELCFPKMPSFPPSLEMLGTYLWKRIIVSLTLGDSDKV